MIDVAQAREEFRIAQRKVTALDEWARRWAPLLLAEIERLQVAGNGKRKPSKRPRISGGSDVNDTEKYRFDSE